MNNSFDATITNELTCATKPLHKLSREQNRYKSPSPECRFQVRRLPCHFSLVVLPLLQNLRKEQVSFHLKTMKSYPVDFFLLGIFKVKASKIKIETERKCMQKHKRAMSCSERLSRLVFLLCRALCTSLLLFFSAF